LPAREIFGDLSARATLTSHDLLSHLSKANVIRLQKALAAAGAYRGAVSGAVNSELKTALKVFQKRNNLTDNGLTLETIHSLVVYDIVPPGFRCH